MSNVIEFPKRGAAALIPLSRKVYLDELKEAISLVVIDDIDIVKGINAAIRVADNGECVLTFKEILAIRLRDIPIRII